jgi:hypothetical protein
MNHISLPESQDEALVQLLTILIAIIVSWCIFLRMLLWLVKRRA